MSLQRGGRSQITEGLECPAAGFRVYPRGHGSHRWFMTKRMVVSALIGKAALCSVEEGTEGITVLFKVRLQACKNRTQRGIEVQFLCYSEKEDIYFALTALIIFFSWL